MAQLYWHTTGTGAVNLVLLHGWGLNAEVWSGIIDRLSPHFCLHLVDLPGFGRSAGYPAITLDEMTAIIQDRMPDRALVLGWSLGGLVATQLARYCPQRVTGLISVASSPCFTQQEDWPGIVPAVLQRFQQQLSGDFQRTVERFLILQTLGTASAREDAQQLKTVVLSQPFPAVETLEGGLEILRTTDLRSEMAAVSTPLLRIYGYLDGLVPRRVAALLDNALPDSQSVVIDKAAHAPFISHPELFCRYLLDFSMRVVSRE